MAGRRSLRVFFRVTLMRPWRKGTFVIIGESPPPLTPSRHRARVHEVGALWYQHVIDMVMRSCSEQLKKTRLSPILNVWACRTSTTRDINSIVGLSETVMDLVKINTNDIMRFVIAG